MVELEAAVLVACGAGYIMVPCAPLPQDWPGRIRVQQGHPQRLSSPVTLTIAIRGAAPTLRPHPNGHQPRWATTNMVAGCEGIGRHIHESNQQRSRFVARSLMPVLGNRGI